MRAKADFHIKRGQERSLDTANIVKANEIFKREREMFPFYEEFYSNERVNRILHRDRNVDEQRKKEGKNKDELK